MYNIANRYNINSPTTARGDDNNNVVRAASHVCLPERARAHATGRAGGDVDAR